MTSHVCVTEHMKDPAPLIQRSRSLCPGGRFVKDKDNVLNPTQLKHGTRTTCKNPTQLKHGTRTTCKNYHGPSSIIQCRYFAAKMGTATTTASVLGGRITKAIRRTAQGAGGWGLGGWGGGHLIPRFLGLSEKT